MMASDLALTRPNTARHVTVDVPPDRSIVGLAVGLYRELGIDVEIADRQIRVLVGPVLAGSVQGALERYTGIRAVNEWDSAA